MKKIIEIVGDPGKNPAVLQNLEQFLSYPGPKQFAVIKVGGGLIDSPPKRASAAHALAVLYESGLLPIVVHGAGPQLDRELTALEIDTPKVNGIRMTPQAAEEVLVRTVTSAGHALKKEVCLQGGDAVYLSPREGVLRATLDDPANLASVSRVEVNTDLIGEVIDSGRIPIIGSVGLQVCPAKSLDQMVSAANTNADVAAGTVAGLLAVSTYISLTNSGGVYNTDGMIINTLSAKEARFKIQEGEIKDGMIPKVTEALCLKDRGIQRVAITSPEDLLSTLFTDQGKGTVIQ